MYWALLFTLAIAIIVHTSEATVSSTDNEEKFIADELTKAIDEMADQSGDLKAEDFDHGIKKVLDSDAVMEKTKEMIKEAMTPEWRKAHQLGETAKVTSTLSEEITKQLGPLTKATEELKKDSDWERRNVDAPNYVLKLLNDQLNTVQSKMPSANSS